MWKRREGMLYPGWDIWSNIWKSSFSITEYGLKSFARKARIDFIIGLASLLGFFLDGWKCSQQNWLEPLALKQMEP